MGVINHRDRPGILEGSSLRQCMFSVWYVNNNQHLSSSVFDTLTQTSLLPLLYKKPGSYGGDASAWQCKHVDLTCARDSRDEQPREESCAWLLVCISWPLWVHTQGCLATDTAWSAYRIPVIQSYRGLGTSSLLQTTNLLTPHKVCCYFSTILGNTLKTGSLFDKPCSGGFSIVPGPLTSS